MDKEITLTLLPSNDIVRFSKEYQEELYNFLGVIPDRKLVKPISFAMDSLEGDGGLFGDFIIFTVAITPIVVGYLSYLKKKGWDVIIEFKNKDGKKLKIRARNSEELPAIFDKIKEYNNLI